MASPTQWTWVRANSGIVKDREAWHAAVHGVMTEKLNDNHNKPPWMAEKRVQMKRPTQQTSERGTKKPQSLPLRALGFLQRPLTFLLGLNLNVFFNILVYEGFIDYRKINDVTLKNIFSLSSF